MDGIQIAIFILFLLLILLLVLNTISFIICSLMVLFSSDRWLLVDLLGGSVLGCPRKRPATKVFINRFVFCKKKNGAFRTETCIGFETWWKEIECTMMCPVFMSRM